VTYFWGNVKKAAALGGSFVQDKWQGATEKFSFTGTSLDLVFWGGPNRGKATVTISTSGSPAITQAVATHAATAGDKTFSWSGLAAVKHTVTITVKGTRNGASSDTLIGVDAFKVDGITTDTPVLTASWSPIFGYTFTTQQSTYATLSFRGAGVTWNALVAPTTARRRCSSTTFSSTPPTSTRPASASTTSRTPASTSPPCTRSGSKPSAPSRQPAATAL
jgi:hypothetical protein